MLKRSPTPGSRRLSLTVPLLLALAGPAAAQDSPTTQPSVIGSTVIGGKRVDLLSDKTWRFAEIEPDKAGCAAINSVLAFCGAAHDWRPTTLGAGDFIRVYRHDDRNYAGMIYEGIGSNEGINTEHIRRIVLEHLANVVGVPVAEIPVLDIHDNTVDGIPAETMIYGATVNGLSVVYQNTMIVSPKVTLQLMSWSISKDLTPAQEELHAAFLDAIEIELEDGRL